MSYQDMYGALKDAEDRFLAPPREPNLWECYFCTNGIYKSSITKLAGICGACGGHGELSEAELAPWNQEDIENDVIDQAVESGQITLASAAVYRVWVMR